MKRRSVQIADEEATEEQFFADSGGHAQGREPAPFNSGRGKKEARWFELTKFQKWLVAIFDAELDDGHGKLQPFHVNPHAAQSGEGGDSVGPTGHGGCDPKPNDKSAVLAQTGLRRRIALERKCVEVVPDGTHDDEEYGEQVGSKKRQIATEGHGHGFKVFPEHRQ